MRLTMLLAAAALMLGAAAPAQANHTPRHGAQATAASALEFSAAKRSRNPYAGQATVYNPYGAGSYGPPSSPGTYGGGF